MARKKPFHSLPFGSRSQCLPCPQYCQLPGLLLIKIIARMEKRLRQIHAFYSQYTVVKIWDCSGLVYMMLPQCVATKCSHFLNCGLDGAHPCSHHDNCCLDERQICSSFQTAITGGGQHIEAKQPLFCSVHKWMEKNKHNPISTTNSATRKLQSNKQLLASRRRLQNKNT